MRPTLLLVAAVALSGVAAAQTDGALGIAQPPLALTDPSGAQPPGPMARLLASPKHLAALERAALQYEQLTGSTCPTASPASVLGVAVLQAPTFTAQEDGFDGAWAVRFKSSVCGPERTYFAQAEVDWGEISAIVLAPGLTRATPALAVETADAMASALALAAQKDGQSDKLKDCRNARVKDTRDLAVFTPQEGVGWREIWSVEACGYTKELKVRFWRDGPAAWRSGVEVSVDRSVVDQLKAAGGG